MAIHETAVRRHVLALMLSAVLVLFGLVSARDIGVDQYPEIEFPMVSVTTTLPGGNPSVIDASVTGVLEARINGIPGIDHIQSSSSPSVSVINVTFDLAKDVDTAFTEVQAKVNQVLRKLPEDAEPPVVAKVEFGALPVFWLALTGDRTEQQLNQYARTVLKKRLETIPGVGQVIIGGERARTIRIELDPLRMVAHGISVQDVRDAFQDQHLQLPGGFLVQGPREDMLDLDLEMHDVAALRAMPVALRDGLVLRLGDIARVEDALADFRKYAAFKGETAVGVGLAKVSGANTVAIVDEAKRRLEEELRADLPPGMRLEVSNDASAPIRTIIDSLYSHLIEGTLFTALIVLVFLKSFRATTIIALAIPVSLLGAVMVMGLMGYTFNTMTLLALLLLIGVVVDDAIVVLESIYRQQEHEGKAPVAAALDGTGRVIFAVMAATLTLVAIFAPVIFLGGIIGRFFQSFAVVVTAGVLISLFVSLTLTPALCSRHLKVPREHGRLYRAFDTPFRALERGYAALLRLALRFRWSVVVVMLVLVGTVGPMFGAIGKGFMPEEDESRFLVVYKTPLGSSIEDTVQAMRGVEAVLREQQEIATFFGVIGSDAAGQVNRGRMFVNLRPRDEREASQAEIMQRLRKALSGLPGVRAFPAPYPKVRGQRGEPLQFAITGPNLGEVTRISEALQTRLQQDAELGRVDLDLDMDLPQSRVVIDRARAAELGISAEDIGLAVSTLIGGADIAQFNDDPGDGERYDIRLKALEGSMSGAGDLGRIHLRAANGELVRLDNLARLEPMLGPANITRLDLRYAAMFYSNPTIALAEALERARTIADELLPPGYRLQPLGQAEEFGKTAGHMQLAFALALVLVYMVLASQFNAFVQPVVIMLAQPLAIIGGVAALWLSGHTLNIYSMIGLVLLVGLVAKNSILLIDLTNQLRGEGLGIREALLEACPVRMRPVLMTSLTIILAMLPAAMQAAGDPGVAALSMAVIGGVLSSTLLTLVVVPAVYSLVEGGIARMNSRVKAG